MAKDKNKNDRATEEAERRARKERERQEREAERAREREEREREREDRDDDTPQEPGLVLASVQVFNQMPPYQLYVLSNGQTIATPETPGDLIASVRQAIWDHFIGSQPEPTVEDTPEDEPLEPAGDDIPVEVLDDDTQDPADDYEALGDQMDEDARDQDGNAPEDYTALESAPLPPRQQAVTIPLPSGVTEEDARAAIADAITRIQTKGQNPA